MELPTSSQRIGWVALLTLLGLLAAVRIGCGQAAAGGRGELAPPATGALAPSGPQAAGSAG